MSVNIPAFYVQQYSTNIQLMLQQKGSRFRGKTMEGSHVGKQASPVNQIYAVEAQQVLGRFQPIGRQDAQEDRRWVFPVDFDLNQLIDSFDKLRLLTDPMSQYVTNAIYAMGRAIDRQFVKNVFAGSANGQGGATSIAFPTALSSAGGQVVSVSQGAAGATGLTVSKLREAKRILMANEVDLEQDPIYCGITAKQHDNLLAEAQVIDLDYTDRPVLVEGRITRFMGFDFVHSELLSANNGADDAAGTSTPVPVWAKSGMYIGIWEDAKNDISQRKDLQGLPFQAYSEGSFGATRLDEKRVVKIWCR